MDSLLEIVSKIPPHIIVVDTAISLIYGYWLCDLLRLKTHWAKIKVYVGCLGTSWLAMFGMWFLFGPKA
jgi:hypothetical protein